MESKVYSMLAKYKEEFDSLGKNILEEIDYYEEGGYKAAGYSLEEFIKESLNFLKKPN